MKIIDFLKVFDATTLKVAIYNSGDNENELIWSGFYADIPWWVADYELETDKEKLDHDSPIDYRLNFNNDKPGLVIIVKEDD
jgi:hypothetical protein